MEAIHLLPKTKLRSGGAEHALGRPLGRFLFVMERYNKILEKNEREIVLLRGSGCVYRKCAFCDYHTDKCSDQEANYALNSQVLGRVTGEFGDLEVINSGSVFELDPRTLALVRQICLEKEISTIHFESHYLYRDRIPALRQEFSPFRLKMKLGLETFRLGFPGKCPEKRDSGAGRRPHLPALRRGEPSVRHQRADSRVHGAGHRAGAFAF